MPTDELPPRDDAPAIDDATAIDEAVIDEAAIDEDLPETVPDAAEADAPATEANATDADATQAFDVAALIERENAEALTSDADATQAFDVAALIALEKGAARRAVSAAELDEDPDPAPSRSSRRARREAVTVAALLDQAVPTPSRTAPAAPVAVDPDPSDTSDPVPEPDPTPPATAALAWISPAALGSAPEGPAVVTELLPPTRAPRRAAAIAAPLITAAVIGIGYVAGCALWPLANIAPTVSAATVEPAAGRPLGVTWPQDGVAAVGAEGLGTVPSSSSTPSSMASITKLVTVQMILEKAPLEAEQDGPSYAFTAEDRNLYWQYRYGNQSSLDVPVDGTLTERQMLEGILIGSANNYIDRLTTELWGSKEAFVAAVPAWLEAHGLPGITLVDPSGIDPGNTATAADLVKLASLALADPTIAQIVAMPEIELPGAGKVENTNPLLGDPGVVGIKTGTLLDQWPEQWNLLTAKDITIGQTTVRLYSAVLGQPTEDDRASVSRQLLDQVEQSLQLAPSVAADTVVATVSTEWGASAEVVTTADAQVILWDSGTAAIDSDYSVDVGQLDGASVGELTATGPFDSAEVPLALEGDLPGPSFGWRLTHPLDLLGLQ